MFLSKYRYFAKPEGEDPLGKLLACLNVGLMASIPVTLSDIMIHTKTPTFSRSFQRIIFWMVPINGACLVFPSVTFMVTRIRGKDGYLNHVIGALSTLPILRAWLKLPFVLTVNAGVIMTAVALLNKGARDGFGDMHDINTRALGLPQYNKY